MVTAVVGGQFGSEGKGLIVAHVAGAYTTHVRVGAANAGHTIYVDGSKFVMQQLPCAAYANPHASLVLGAGALISPEILERELSANVVWREQHHCPKLRLFIDHRAHVIQPEHIEQEQQTDLAERIGSTSTIAREGIGSAQAARVLRTGYRLAQEFYDTVDTTELLHDAMLMHTPILLEGTQGTGLSNTTGFYPYVTSRNTTAAGLAADCGIGPRDIDHVIMVCRTFPIRVAGNSGPFWGDSREVSWMDVGIDPSLEKTTVTKKIRRVGTFSFDQVKQAARLNSATEIALTFADYIAPELRDRSGIVTAEECDGIDYVGPMVREVERRTGVGVTMIGTGPQTVMERDPISALVSH